MINFDQLWSILINSESDLWSDSSFRRPSRCRCPDRWRASASPRPTRLPPVCQPEIECLGVTYLWYGGFLFCKMSGTEWIQWMSQRKRGETKQQPGTAGPGNILGCCLVSLCFLRDIHSIPSVDGRVMWECLKQAVHCGASSRDVLLCILLEVPVTNRAAQSLQFADGGTCEKKSTKYQDCWRPSV